MTTTAQQLKDYVLRQLGFPMHSIEITPEQLDDAINTAFERFNEGHYNSIIQNVYKLDLINGQNSYQLPETIKAVIDIIPASNLLCGLDHSEKLLIPLHSSFNDYMWQFADVTQVMTYRMTRQMYDEEISFKNVIFDFNYPLHRLNIIGSIENLKEKFNNENSFFLVVYESSEDVGDFLGDRWFKAYCVALAKKQWGVNLMKYSEVPLPGGTSLNSDKILDQAEREIEKLEEQFEDEYKLPARFSVG